MKYRRAFRECAMQVLSSLLIIENDPEETLCFVKKNFAPKVAEKDNFLDSLVFGVLENRIEIGEKISKFAPEWPLEKMDPVERAILEVGIFEILKTDTPIPVILNEAIEIAKKFGDDTASKFINGVLDAVARSVNQLKSDKKK